MIETPEAHAPLIQRLARDFGAAWVDEHSVAEWTAGGGDRVVLLAGDVRLVDTPSASGQGQRIARCPSTTTGSSTGRRRASSVGSACCR